MSSSAARRMKRHKEKAMSVARLGVRQRRLSPVKVRSFVKTTERTDSTGSAIIYEDGEYAVAKYEPDNHGITCLTVQRIYRKPARDWRDLQRIKNDLVGPEREGFEVFPPESHLIDLSNTTWLWVMPEGSPLVFTIRQGRQVSR